jgi:heptose-I-phosphate ethanolaminephosphotransferase
MFLTGWLSCQVELTPHLIGAEPYEHAAEELFVDLYLLCLLLSLIPRKVRQWVRGLLAVLLYAVAIADVYCYVRFESMLTPTMLMLVGETNSREASEFLSTAFSWTLLSTPLLCFLIIPGKPCKHIF